jgi:YbbR domain-containing protein
MKPNWTKNLGLKVGSLVFATIMWIVVTNINDPVDYRTFENIPVRILNARVLDDLGRVYEVLDDTDIIERVTVRAPRSVISRIGYSNIIARADINNLSSLDTIAITLEVNNVSASEINEISGSSDILRLNIEEKRTRTFGIQIIIEGEAAEGYMSGDITIEPNIVRISGPESLVSEVSYAAASVDITNFTNDISTNVEIGLYDATGKRLSVDRISQNAGAVSLRIPILEKKTVPIRYTVSGTPAYGYLLNGFDSLSLTQVEVAGKGNVFHNFNAINIPAERTDVSDRSTSFTEDLNLNEFLPEGIRLVDRSLNMVKIAIGIEEEADRQVTLRKNQIQVVSVPYGYEYSLVDVDEIAPFNLTGLQKDLDAIIEEDLVAELDIAQYMNDRGMEQMREGFYNIPLEIEFAPNITVTNTVTVLVNFREAEVSNNGGFW